MEFPCAIITSIIIDEAPQKSPGSFVKATYGRRRHCWVCNDVWMDIFPFFDHAQLGLTLALISPRFDALVDTHFNGKSEFTIWRQFVIDKLETTKRVVSVSPICIKRVQFPLPGHSLPNKIRFENLCIDYIDHSVIEFLRSNQQIFDKGTSLSLYIPPYHNTDVLPIWDVFIREIWPIFATNIRQLNFVRYDDLDNLRSLISPTILTDLDQLNSIDADDLLPAAIGDDGPNATDEQALSKWLHTPRIDGKPKQLICRATNAPEDWVNSFKEPFLRATTNSSSSACYKIQIFVPASMQIKPFELENEWTQQKLTLRKEREDGKYWLLKRCPIFGGTAAAFQWEDENCANLNIVIFHLNGANNCIGPLSTDSSGGSSI